MSLEQALQENTAAINALTAALKAGGGKAATASTETTTSKPKADAKPKKEEPTYKFDKAAAQALAQRVKEEKGVPAARALIKEVGFEKLAEIIEAKDFNALGEAATKLLAEEGGADEDDGGL